MSVSLRAGVAWNLSGTLLSALGQFVTVPFLVQQLGPRGMGVIAFSWLVTAIAAALEMGLAPALAGELSRRRSQPDAPPADRRLLRAFEIPSWVVAAGIGAAVAAGGGWISERWLSLDAAEAAPRQAVSMMGLVAGLTLPMSLYVSGLLGLERYRGANLTRVLTTVLQYGGGVLAVLWLPDPRVWLVTAMVAQGAGVVLGRTLLLRSLAGGRGIDWAGLRARGTFAGGLGGIGILSALIASLDRVVVSRLLSLEVFTAYSLAAMIGNGFRLLATPVFSALYPRLTSLLSSGDRASAAHLYVMASRWMAAVFAPAVAVVALAGRPLLEAWCGDHELATLAAPAAGLLAAGSALNALMTAPYALQLSARWTRPGLASAGASLVITAAVIAAFAPRYGAVGAALAWPVANLLVLVVMVPVTHRRVLDDVSWIWPRAVLGPVLAAWLIAVSAGLLLPWLNSSAPGALLLGTASLAASATLAWHQGRQDQEVLVSKRAT